MSAPGPAPVPIDAEPTNAPPANSDLATSWRFLETGCNRIMLNMQTGMSYSYYMLLYTACYNYCVMNKTPDAGMGGFSAGRTGASLMGADLYGKLTLYFQNHCRRLAIQGEQMSDIALLRFYVSEWDRYTTGSNYVNRLFTYLNRHWVKREKDEGRKGIYPVYTLALVQWKEYFFAHMTKKQNRLVQAVLKQIENQRNGEEIDATLIRKVIDSMVALGLDDTETNHRANLEVYKEQFQIPFIAATEQYYRAESESFVAENSISDYLKRAEKRLNEEEVRVERYLHSSTRKSLISRCENVLVSEHQDRMHEEFESLLGADRADDLRRMWDLLVRVPDGLEKLRQKFEQHVKESGLDAVQKVSQGSVNAEGKAEMMDPKSYIEALLDVHKKNSEVVERSFRGESGFTAALDKACRAYVNTNVVATVISKSPELLASYVDSLLKKSNKEAGDATMEDSLNDCMTIFKYIADRDVFQKFYSKNLANRLVRALSASDEAEGSMISKLKEACGFEYTSKLQKMITDVNLSKDLTEQYKEKMRQTHNAEDLEIDFSIIIGGMNNWPLQPQATDFAIPRALVPIHDRFGRFYTNAHSGRKLTWLWHLSKNELRMNYTNPKYILMTSAYQMAILVLFNEDVSLSQQEIEAVTKINPAQLIPVLSLLVKAKVLLQDGDQYDLNLNFKSKKIRVNINQAIRSDKQTESTEVLKAVDEDRKFVYQASIVRVMKSRKQMKHQTLITEVTGMLSANFTPKVSEMKKAIDYLLDKEYLERVEGTKDQYKYLA